MAITKEQLDRRVEGQTICSRFLDRVDADPNRVALRAFVDDDPDSGKAETWTWSEYADHVARAAAGLRMLGVGPGDRVVLMLRNIARFHFVDLAVNFLGATSVSVFTASEPEQVAEVASDCRAKVAVVEDAELLERVLMARDEEELSDLRHVLLLDNPLGLRSPGVLDGVEILEGQRALKLRDEVDNAEPDDPATVLYTARTTESESESESPNSVELSHHDIVWAAEAYAEVLDDDTVGLRAVSYLPMAHVAERMAGHYLGVIAGLEVTTCPWPDDLPAYVRAVRPEVLFGVPRVWETIQADIEAALADDPDAQETFDEAMAKALPIAERQATGSDTDDEVAWAELDEDAFRLVRKRAGLNALKLAVSGAAPIPADLILWFRAIGVPLSELDGLADAAGTVDGALPDCAALLGADIDALFPNLDADDSDDLA